MSPIVLCLTSSGEAVAARAARVVGGRVHGRRGRVRRADAFFDATGEHLRELFLSGTPVIGVCAAGILVRSLAPVLSRKGEEPPVVALPEDGSAAVPLLGGHRGANALAIELADGLGCRAAITTAGDVSLGAALDAPPPGWRLADGSDTRTAMARILAGEGVRIDGENLWGLEHRADGAVSLVATERPVAPAPDKLVYHPQTHVLGVGCSRGCPPEELKALALNVLDRAGVAPGSVAFVASLELKADEPAVTDLAQELGTQLRLFSSAELEAETPRLANPSETVFRAVGCHGVAEAAALATVGAEGCLAVPKTGTGAATCALARGGAPLTKVPGRPRGRLSIVGVGPGKAAWRTPEASRLLAEAEEIVGYGPYVELVGFLRLGRKCREFPLGDEEARCRYALERAGEGKTVALVSSGDAGIYAMAAVVFELIDRAASGDGGLSDAARRVEILCSPGVSALQAAAALGGAPLGHDFCAISLSDLLTPRETILRRVRSAAEGDFVVAFYNPSSTARRTLLTEARDILLGYRPPETPVILARALGREQQRIRHVDLAGLDVADTDMLTTVLVGSSRSRRCVAGGAPRMYTPRGYAISGQAKA